jgi:hypothetical protein
MTGGTLHFVKSDRREFLFLQLFSFHRAFTHHRSLKVLHDVTKTCRGDGLSIQVQDAGPPSCCTQLLLWISLLIQVGAKLLVLVAVNNGSNCAYVRIFWPERFISILWESVKDFRKIWRWRGVEVPLIQWVKYFILEPQPYLILENDICRNAQQSHLIMRKIVRHFFENSRWHSN